MIEPLLAFVQQLPPTDLVAVYYPLDSTTDVHFSRDREPVLRAIGAFTGRCGDYQPTRPVEEEHLRYPQSIERIRRQITMSALEGLATQPKARLPWRRPSLRRCSRRSRRSPTRFGPTPTNRPSRAAAS